MPPRSCWPVRPVLLMMVVVLMMGYIRLMQASHDVTVKQAQLQQAQEDNVALGVAYEKAFDQSSVKAAAQAAGMTKPTTDQIEYIELGGADMAENSSSRVHGAPGPGLELGKERRGRSGGIFPLERRHIVKTRKE